jgi:hypothetical protein
VTVWSDSTKFKFFWLVFAKILRIYSTLLCTLSSSPADFTGIFNSTVKYTAILGREKLFKMDCFAMHSMDPGPTWGFSTCSVIQVYRKNIAKPLKVGLYDIPQT